MDTLTRKDFVTERDVRWCPGCGDYAILAQLQRVLPTLGIRRENFVFVSGIGCSSRLPYYVNTYGIHSIHGRAPAVATGVLAVQPELSVWVVTGDGDGLSIGGNHLMHAVRRNVNMRVLLFNNRIYGLTKGQYSPTSELGKSTKSTPLGSLDAPLDPLRFVLGAGGSFIARTMDIEAKHQQDLLTRAAKHVGTAFVEIYQNCNIFNDHAFVQLTDKTKKQDHVLWLEHGQPLIFGADRDRVLTLDGNLNPTVKALSDCGENNMWIHDESNLQKAFLLTQLGGSKFPSPAFPVPMGVFFAENRPTYERSLQNQIRSAMVDSANPNQSAATESEPLSNLPTATTLVSTRPSVQTLLDAGEIWSQS